LISDNGSDERTSEVVASFSDKRIEYVRSNTNVGMTANYNRIISLAQSEFLVVLPDDDILYPNYLAHAMSVLRETPSIGVAHTAFDLIDPRGNVIRRARRLVGSQQGIGLERGGELIERGMRSSGLACWTSCLFRTTAITAAGGARDEDEPFGDGPLIMRIALNWDIAWLAEPLVAVRVHEESVSASHASLSDGGYDPSDTLPETLLKQRIGFLDEAEARLAPREVRRYRSLARESYRRETVGRLARQIGVRRGRIETLHELAKLVRKDGRTLLVPGMLKLLVSLLTGHFVALGKLDQLSKRRAE
jgi:glycosyltransferase involved in cell wall biosynthesis